MQSFVFFKYLFTIAVDVNMFWWLWFKHYIWYQEGWKIIVLTSIPVHLFNVSLAPALACSNRQQRQKIIWQRSHFCHHSGAGLLYSVQWKLLPPCWAQRHNFVHIRCTSSPTCRAPRFHMWHIFKKKWNEGAVCSMEAMETSWAIITLALYQMIPSNLPGRLQCPSCWGCFGYNANFCPGCSFLQNIWPFRSSDGSLLHCWHGRKGSDAYHKLYFHHHLRLNHNYINT